MMRWMMMSVVLLWPALAASESTRASHRVGDTYEIRLDRESSEQTDDMSSGSSTDRDVIMERVVGVRDGGVELEYDLPADATAEDRASSWQFPARVFKPLGGAPELLNSPDLAARVDGWLKTAGLSHAACGHWIFTWTAIHIDCDPQSVIPMIQTFDLRPGDLHDGAPYRDPAAQAPAPLRRKALGADDPTFTVEMAADPEAVRRSRAETDVVIAEIGRKTLTLEDALQAHAADAIAGTITVTFETDRSGEVRRRTKVTKLRIRRADGHVETRTVTDTLERRLAGRATA